MEVCLPENPTTGYRWAVDSVDSNILKLQNSKYSMGGNVGIGGGGTRTMIFQGAAVGNTNLNLNLWREWVGASSIINRFRVTVNVAR